MKLVYTAEIDEEIYSLEGLRESLDQTMFLIIGCNILKSRLESPDEICESEGWEDDNE